MNAPPPLKERLLAWLGIGSSDEVVVVDPGDPNVVCVRYAPRTKPPTEPAAAADLACPACGTPAAAPGACRHCGLDLAPLHLLAALAPAPTAAVPANPPRPVRAAWPAALGVGLVVGACAAAWVAPGRDVPVASASLPPAASPRTPTAAPPRPQEPAPAYHLVYRIRRGDTLSAIAWRFYGDPAALASLVQANPGVEPRALRIGTPLRLPLPPAGTPAPLSLERIVP